VFKRGLSVLLALSFALVFYTAPALAAGEEADGLSLDQAVKMALERNRALKIQRLAVDKSTEQLDDLRDTIKHVPATGVYIPEVSAVWSGFLQARAGERIAQKEFEYALQQTVVDVKEKYYAVLSHARQVELAETDLMIARTKMNHARLKYRLGMLTQAELLGMETQLKNAQSSLVTAQNDLDQSYTELAMLTGLNENDRPELKDETVFEEAQFTSLDAVLARALSQNHSVWAAEQAALVAKRVREHAANYEVGAIEAKIKDIEAGSAREQVRAQVKLLYLTLQGLEKAHATLEQKVAVCEEALRVARIQQEVGLATVLQVQEAEAACNEAVKDLRQLVYSYDQAKSQLEILTGKDIIPA